MKRLQDWNALPSIAAENRNYPAGAESMAKHRTRRGISSWSLSFQARDIARIARAARG
ncbi:MAG TPA: hypothetical protein VF505_07535 [Thermoanaerobaculia bacterium]